MEYGKNIFLEDDIIHQLSKYTGKYVMHIKAVGAIECNDSQKEESIWDFYFGKCDLNVLNILMQFKEAYCYFETLTQATDAYEEWFPCKKQLLEEESHLFVKVILVSPDGSLTAFNE
jgi:hypothetical protein